MAIAMCTIPFISHVFGLVKRYLYADYSVVGGKPSKLK